MLPWVAKIVVVDLSVGVVLFWWCGAWCWCGSGRLGWWCMDHEFEWAFH